MWIHALSFSSSLPFSQSEAAENQKAQAVPGAEEALRPSLDCVTTQQESPEC